MSRERTSLQNTCRCRAFKAGATLLIGLVAGCLTQCLRAGEARAQGANTSLPQTSPLPPRRPSEFGSQPATPAERQPGASAPAPTGGSPSATTTAAPERPPDVLLDREAIRTCGTQWQKMKMDGSASGKSWREFSHECAMRGPTQR